MSYLITQKKSAVWPDLFGVAGAAYAAVMIAWISGVAPLWLLKGMTVAVTGGTAILLFVTWWRCPWILRTQVCVRRVEGISVEQAIEEMRQRTRLPSEIGSTQSSIRGPARPTPPVNAVVAEGLIVET